MSHYTDSLPFKVGDVLTDYSSVAIEVQRIAQGGMGLVAFGPDRLWEGRMHALKTLRPDVLARNSHVRDLFIREALTWVGVWPHANVLTAQFVTEIHRLPMLLMDYAEYGDLRRHLRPGLDADQALMLAQHIAAGLAYLHTPDPDHLRPDPIIHRDLKPENILIDGKGFARITDFGLAKTLAAVAEAEAMGNDDEEPDDVTDGTISQHYHTRRGSAMGTTAYMAPEQWDDAATAGQPADAYAFGIILGELLLGDHPLLPLHERHSQDEWHQAHLSGSRRPLPSVYPMPMQQLYAALLNPDPTQRPTVSATFAELQSLARRLQLPVYTVPDVFPPTIENQVAFWMSWANAYGRFNLYDEALVRNNQARALAPDNPRVLASRGTILAGLGRTEEALYMYDASLAARPPEDHRGRSIVLHQQGVLFNESKRYAAAEDAFAAALREMPDAAGTWYNRTVNQLQWGRSELQAGDTIAGRDHLQIAMRCAQQALVLGPQDTGTHHLLAQIQAMLAQIGA